MDPGLGDIPVFFVVAFGVFGLIFIAVVTLIVTSGLRSRKVLRDSGLDPLAAPAELAARLARGPLATPAKSLEERLTELDDLHRRGLITQAERDAARTTALSS